jgi:hypothetical protein
MRASAAPKGSAVLGRSRARPTPTISMSRRAGDLQKFFGAIWDRITRSYLVRFPASDGRPDALDQGLGRRAERRDPGSLSRDCGAGLAVGSRVALRCVVIADSRSCARACEARAARVRRRAAQRRGASAAARGRLRIGAIEANDLVIPSMAVSRYHAELHVSGRRVEIVDLHSANGTHINGNRVERAALTLRPGDRIRIADVELVYER